MRHQEALRAEDVGVGAGADLWWGPVEFVDGGFGGWEGCDEGVSVVVLCGSLWSWCRCGDLGFGIRVLGRAVWI